MCACASLLTVTWKCGDGTALVHAITVVILSFEEELSSIDTGVFLHLPLWLGPHDMLKSAVLIYFSANVTGIVFFFLPVGLLNFARKWGCRQGMNAHSVCFIHAVHPWLFLTFSMSTIPGLPMCWRCDCVRTKILQHLALISSWGCYHWAGRAWTTWPLTEVLSCLQAEVSYLQQFCLSEVGQIGQLLNNYCLCQVGL